MKIDNNIDENDIWIKSMKRYHRYTDCRGIGCDQSTKDHQIRYAKQLLEKWFVIYNTWFGIKRKISSIEELVMMMDLIGI